MAAKQVKSKARKTSRKKAARSKTIRSKTTLSKTTRSKTAQAKATKKLVKKKVAPKSALRMTAMALEAQAGPVTLEEARMLASTTRPRLAARRVNKAVAPPASPAPLGQERQRLRKEQREERARRIDDYKATMDIMKRRGARRPRRAAKSGQPPANFTADDDSFRPLQVFAEGDSWFDYPVPLFGGGIVPRLEHRLGVPVLNLAKAGDETRYMLGVEERQILADQFSKGCPSGGHWDALLFSGGGNDIVGNPMALWIKDWNPALPPAGQINQKHFSAALALVEAAYEELIEMRDQLSPNTHLIFHGYDFAIPDNRGICFLGPWLAPTFKLRKFPSISDGQAVVKVMLQQFAAMLSNLTARHRVTLIATQGTLQPTPASWHNELHPEKPGFESFADIFHVRLKQLFPDRVA